MPSELQSQDHRNLLDIVDKLRSTGINRYIDLPQIVVCGDQSAGKSSVLEAISGIRFPTKDNLCTRFATELVLRRDDCAAVKVSIIPGLDREDEESSRLSKFNHEVDIDSPDLSGVTESAKEAMGLSEAKVFSSDILRIELQGIEQPHLTLVDLPGLFRAGNKEQSVDEAPIVQQMVRGYMEKPRSIILAVVSAKSDFALQEVTQYARELDPKGLRTLGLITKPDTLPKGSDSEAAYIAMAQNKDVIFRLGWHVLKNRSFETRNVSAEIRDLQENQFFTSGAWASLSPSAVGIRSLKLRLSGILKDHILQHLPSLQSDVVTGIDECRYRLTQLGEPRATLDDQRRYLRRVSWEFSVLMKAAVDGTYNDAFFGSAKTEEGYQRRLRAVVQNTLEDFSDSVRSEGRTRLIVEDNQEHPSNGDQSTVIHRTAYVSSVKEQMRRSRGSELPGTFNPLINGELFREQCQPWRGLVSRIRNSILRSVNQMARAILEHVATNDTVDALTALVDRSIDELGRNVDAKIEDLLRPHHAGHPITYNHYLISNVQNAQANRQRRALEASLRSHFGQNEVIYNVDVGNVIKALHEREEFDMGSYASHLAVDYMQAYYKVAMKTFVDDVSIHAIEEQLIQKLPPVLNYESLDPLSEPQIAHLAAENKSAALDRAHNYDKLQTLTKAMQELQGFDKTRLEMNGTAHSEPDILVHNSEKQDGPPTRQSRCSDAAYSVPPDSSITPPPNVEEESVLAQTNEDDFFWPSPAQKKKKSKK